MILYFFSGRGFKVCKNKIFINNSNIYMGAKYRYVHRQKLTTGNACNWLKCKGIPENLTANQKLIFHRTKMLIK